MLSNKQYQKERSILSVKAIRKKERLLACVFIAGLAVSAASASYAQYAAFEDPQSSGQKNAGPDFKPSAPVVEGGNIVKGDVAQIITVFKNVTNMPISVKGISLYPSANVTADIGTDNCSKMPVPPSAECAVTTNIAGVSDGPYRVEILVDHDGRSRLSTTAITGTIGSLDGASVGTDMSPQLNALPQEIDFDKLETRTPLVRSVMLNNTTSSAITIESIELLSDTKAGLSMSAQDCEIVDAGKSCLATIMWSPFTVGKAEGVLMVKHDGPKGLTMVPIKGEYDPKNTGAAEIFPDSVPGKGLIVSDRLEVDFGDEVDGASSITVSLVNTGDAPVELESIKLAGSDNGLVLTQDGCFDGMELEPLDACPLTVSWQPRRKGPVIDDIQVRHNGVRGVLVIPVRGQADTPVVADKSLVSIQSNIMALPKLSGADLQVEKVKGKETLDSVSVRATTSAKKSGSLSLDGYKVTSHAPTRAVITGPFGRMIVNDGEMQMLGGYPWIVRIVPEGVELVGDTQVVLLVFDRSFTTKIEKEVSQIADDESSSSNK